MRHITLIGMPGAGKSVLGRRLAQRTGRGFVDIDKLIEAGEGEPLGDVLRRLGREAFLDTECRYARELRPETPMVIAPGGSIVYREPAMRHLRSLGPVVLIDVPLPELTKRLGDPAARAARGVVLPPGATLADLHAERMPLYRQWCSHALLSRGAINPTFNALLRLLNDE